MEELSVDAELEHLNKEKEEDDRFMEEFRSLCKPLFEYLKHFDSHTKVIIDNSGAEILQGFVGIRAKIAE